MAEGKTKRRNKITIHPVETAEDLAFNPVNLLEEITLKYSAVNEEDFDLNEIYQDRKPE